MNKSDKLRKSQLNYKGVSPGGKDGDGSLLPSTISGMREAQAHMLENDPLLIPFADEIAGYTYSYPSVANFSNASDYSTQWMNRAVDGLVSPREAALQIIHLTNAAEAEIRRQRQ